MLFQTDVYSYGIILYELLAGQVPFPLKDNGETSRNHVMLSHMESAVPDLLALRKENLPDGWPKREMEVPGWLMEMIATCLEKKPEDRYVNGEALHEVISDASIKEVRVEVVREVKVPAPELTPAPILIDKSNILTPAGTMRLSTSVFAGLMILLAGFMAYSGYSLFRPMQTVVKPINTVYIDTAHIVDSVRNVDAKRYEARRAKQNSTDSARKAAIDKAMRGNPDSTATDTITHN
jgi:serine/threonine-protein kinase